MTIPIAGRVTSLSPRTTRVASSVPESESSGFLLLPDQPPELVEATSRYRIIDELGRGGMGIVYRARDLDLNRDVAVKVLMRAYVYKTELAQQFIGEARIIGALQHPGIVHIFECGKTNGEQPFYAMKLVRGKTLFSLLNARADDQGQRTGELLNIFSHVCQAMAYTHAQNVIHLDLKPANIMVGKFGEVHVMDWGLARFLEQPADRHAAASDDYQDSIFPLSDAKPRRSNHVRGTINYMAPEQARTEPVDRRTDVFCLGAILCEILTNKPLYDAEDRLEVLAHAQNARVEPAFNRMDACESDLALVRLAKRCLQADPDDRPMDASEVASELAAYSQTTLERVENDMTRFFELSLDLFCIAGFDGFFRRINGNFSRVLGFSESELLSRPFLDFVVEEDRSRTIEVMGDLLDGQPVVRFRNRYRTCDGNEIKFEWTAKSIPSENLIFAVARNLS